MLKSLAIRDIVLIDRLDLGFGGGLCVLTGETGAGKSIILDALGLALGQRSDRALVRQGSAQGSVAAAFEPPMEHPVWTMLEEQGHSVEPADGHVVLRRIVTGDGRSRAFVNDEPISTQFMRRLGDALVEVHGQNDQQELAEAAQQRWLLDAFGGLEEEVRATAAAHAAWQGAMLEAAQRQAALESARREEDYLRHREAELADLAPVAGEEEELSQRRHQLMNRDRLMGTLDEAVTLIAGDSGGRERLMAALRRLERQLEPDNGTERAAAALSRALVELDEAEAELDRLVQELDCGGDRLEEVEGRLFALRAAGRKHRVAVDELPALLAETQTLLAGIDSGADALGQSERLVGERRAVYVQAADRLGAGRAKAAAALARAVMAELAPLKLERARFRVALEPLAEQAWGPGGHERVAFEISTNPGTPFGPLGKIASGGELSRIMLALKVVLARVGLAPTMIFDEVDAGIGGAVAAAVGERLARLARERQILVVTHAPQVAARGDDHLTVVKQQRGKERTGVTVRHLAPAERQAEIARMLAGAEVTPAAMAAAASLLAMAGPTEQPALDLVWKKSQMD